MPPKRVPLKSVIPEGGDEQRLRFEGRADRDVAAISGPSGDAESLEGAAKALHDILLSMLGGLEALLDD